MTGALMGRPSASVSLFLVAVNVLVYAVHGPGDVPHGQGDWALWPDKVRYLHEYYRLFSAGFVHFGIIHIAFNMVALISVGPQLEAMLGRWRFAALYVLSLLGGSALSYLLLPVNSLGGGASGAIFGLMGGLLVVRQADELRHPPAQRLDPLLAGVLVPARRRHRLARPCRWPGDRRCRDVRAHPGAQAAPHRRSRSASSSWRPWWSSR